VKNVATAKHQNIQAAKIFLNPLAEAADVFILGEVGRTRVAVRA